MNELKFIIIEDEAVALHRLRKFLIRGGYSPHVIWPLGTMATTHASWAEVGGKLLALQNEGWNPEHDCCVLLADLALSDDSKPLDGIDAIKRDFSEFYRHYVIVAYSSSGAHVKENPRFDGYIQKSDLVRNESDDAQRVKRSIERAIQAWSARTGRAAPSLPAVKHRLDDSPTARLAEVALGESSIDYLITTVATNWSNVRARALTGGLSGSFVLRIDGSVDRAERSVVCKVSKEDGVLQQELAAWQKASESPVASNLLSPLQPIQPIPGEQARYMTLATVAGMTLEQALTAPTSILDDSNRELEAFIRKSAHATMLYKTTDLLRMKPHELARIGDAIRALNELGDACVVRGVLTSADTPNAATCDALSAVVREWPERLARPGLAEISAYPQHGDLHARNILIGTRPVIIDWARYRAWPMAYDVQRLELLLLVRVFRTRGMADHFVDGVAPLWPLLRQLLDNDLTRPLSIPDPGDAAVVGQLELVRRWRASILDEESSGTDRALRVRSFHVGRCHDALRAAAYQDISPFKRLFCLHAAIESARAANLLPAAS